MKMLSKLAIVAAVAAVTASSAAFASEDAAMEKCYGVAKAGKNDCKGAGNATCAGHAAKDGQGFVTVPKGTCEKLAGGSTMDTAK